MVHKGNPSLSNQLRCLTNLMTMREIQAGILLLGALESLGISN